MDLTGFKMSDLRFYVGVREAVDVHGCQVGTAFDAHTEPTPSSLLGFALQFAVAVRGEVLEAEQQTAPLLQTPLLLRLPLKEKMDWKGQGSVCCTCIP